MDQAISTPMVDIDQFHSSTQAIFNELKKYMVGQEAVVHQLIVTLLANGNALLEGVPGLGKTMLVRTLSQILNCAFSRVQFTPDLMPADIVGTMIITETPEGRRGFRFERGPIFANLILADEINRAAPRTQSALLEAMQEYNVTVAGETHPLPRPFFVFATQNPIEMEGTYPLPEAQLDRFLCKIYVSSPSEDELIEIARRTTHGKSPEVGMVSDGKTLLALQELASQVPVEDRVYRYAARIISAIHPEAKNAPESVRRHLRIGVSPRGMQALIRCGKVEALLDQRKAVAIDDIRTVAFPTLRHRLVMNFEAQAEGIPADSIVEDVLAIVPVP